MVHIAILLAPALTGMAAALPNPFRSAIYTDTVRFLPYIFNFMHTS